MSKVRCYDIITSVLPEYLIIKGITVSYQARVYWNYHFFFSFSSPFAWIYEERFVARWIIHASRLHGELPWSNCGEYPSTNLSYFSLNYAANNDHSEIYGKCIAMIASHQPLCMREWPAKRSALNRTYVTVREDGLQYHREHLVSVRHA
jgi:hypothetical protein